MTESSSQDKVQSSIAHMQKAWDLEHEDTEGAPTVIVATSQPKLPCKYAVGNQ